MKFEEFLAFLNQLKSAKIDCSIDQVREDTIMVKVAVPGERWEIEFFTDETVEVEIFRSDGKMLGRPALDDLFRKFSD